MLQRPKHTHPPPKSAPGNLTIMDTLGPEKTVHYTEASTIQRLFHMYCNLSGPTKVVCYREVSTIRGVCYEMFHCIINSSSTSCSVQCRTQITVLWIAKASHCRTTIPYLLLGGGALCLQAILGRTLNYLYVATSVAFVARGVGWGDIFLYCIISWCTDSN